MSDYQNGYDDGYVRGYSDGYNDGYEENDYEEGEDRDENDDYDEGFNCGYNEGYEAGYETGQDDGDNGEDHGYSYNDGYGDNDSDDDSDDDDSHDESSETSVHSAPGAVEPPKMQILKEIYAQYSADVAKSFRDRDEAIQQANTTRDEKFARFPKGQAGVAVADLYVIAFLNHSEALSAAVKKQQTDLDAAFTRAQKAEKRFFEDSNQKTYSSSLAPVTAVIPVTKPAHVPANTPGVARPESNYDGGNTEHWTGPASDYASDRGGGNYGTSSDDSRGNYGTSSDDSMGNYGTSSDPSGGGGGNNDN